ncbi:hypothetical protein C7820_6628 [Paenibacillus sp. VMFN-D1]|nr:hypothetical protein C7820_6628 [Paenibacillus sp. VMFN-D1]
MRKRKKKTTSMRKKINSIRRIANPLLTRDKAQSKLLHGLMIEI